MTPDADHLAVQSHVRVGLDRVGLLDRLFNSLLL